MLYLGHTISRFLYVVDSQIDINNIFQHDSIFFLYFSKAFLVIIKRSTGPYFNQIFEVPKIINKNWKMTGDLNQPFFNNINPRNPTNTITIYDQKPNSPKLFSPLEPLQSAFRAPIEPYRAPYSRCSRSDKTSLKDLSARVFSRISDSLNYEISKTILNEN